MKRFLLFLIALLILRGGPVLAASSSSSPGNTDLTGQCQAETTDELASVNREYRAVLFGQPEAAREIVNASRYDTERNAWLKAAGDRWIHADGRSKNDREMDLASEVKPRKGIFEIRRALTSELIPSLTQAYRAFDCRLETVCKGVNLSEKDADKLKKNGQITLEVPGCLPFVLKALPSCQTLAANNPDIVLARSYCLSVIESMREREADILKMSVNYDAGYRSLLQFAGNFDDFLGQFRGDLLGPVQQTVQIVNQLSRIPCILAECNE